MFKNDGTVQVLEDPDSAFTQASSSTEDIEPAAVRSKFKRFVKEYKHSTSVGQSHIGTMKYRTQFVRNCEEGIYKLEINLNDLGSGTHEDGEILAHILWQKPTEFIPLCETALKELYQELISKDSEQPAPHIQLQFKVDTDLEATFGTRKPTMIRELTSDRVEELVVVQGIVVSAKRARHKARKIFLKCSNCENVKEITINSGFNSAHVPTSCEGSKTAAAMEKCPPSPFQIISERCEFTDQQTLKLQELPEHVPVGEMPRSVDLCVEKYAVDMANPGINSGNMFH